MKQSDELLLSLYEQESKLQLELKKQKNLSSLQDDSLKASLRNVLIQKLSEAPIFNILLAKLKNETASFLKHFITKINQTAYKEIMELNQKEAIKNGGVSREPTAETTSNENFVKLVDFLNYKYKETMKELNEHLTNKFKISKFPRFLLYDLKTRIKSRIKSIYVPHLKDVFVKKEISENKEIQILEKYIFGFKSEEITMFDKSILTESQRFNLCSLIAFILKRYHSRNPYLFVKDKEIYLHYWEKFSTILNLSSEMTENLFFTTEPLPSKVDKLGKMEEHLFLFSILSFHFVLHNYKIENKQITVGNVSAFERQYLYYLFEYLNDTLTKQKKNMLKLSFMLEKFLHCNFISNETSEEIQYTEPTTNFLTFKQMTELALSDPDNIEFNIRFKKYLEKFPKKIKRSRLMKIVKFFEDFFVPYLETKIEVQTRYINLIPYYKMNQSSHACILLSGFISQNHDFVSYWDNLILDYDNFVDFYFYMWDSKTGMKLVRDCFKFFGGLGLMILTRNFMQVILSISTQMSYNNTFSQSKLIAKYVGKLLAYIIVSKQVFKKQTLTIIGFSLGANIVKYCMKEINIIKEFIPEATDIIQNVVFLAAACDFEKGEKWSTILKNVPGRIINCFRSNDLVLRDVYHMFTNSRQSVGCKKLEFGTDFDQVIENYDFSEFDLKHNNYKAYLNHIVTKIKLFN